MQRRSICYLTDPEGNWSYLQRVIRQSKSLYFTDIEEKHIDIKDDTIIVFGGDAGDKGYFTLHCYEEFVRLKKKYPDRVILLAGNRDINKIRFTSELDVNQIPIENIVQEIKDGPHWVPQDKRITIEKYLKEIAGNHEILEYNTRVNRLKYMLEHTMGSQGDFERRRMELERKNIEHGNIIGDSINDDDVLHSYLQSVEDSNGIIKEYLQLCSLAYCWNGTLFVHGGIIKLDEKGEQISILGVIPPSTQELENGSGTIDHKLQKDLKKDISISEWINDLNEWYQAEIKSWLDKPKWIQDKDGVARRGAAGLLESALPHSLLSIVTGRHLQSSGMPVVLKPDIVDQLVKNDIHRVVLGHTPHGNCPTIVRHTGVDVIMCDTSYSDVNAPDNRGIVASNVEITSDGDVIVNGTLENNKQVYYTTKDTIIGQWLQDGTHVKAKVKNEEHEEDLYLTYKVTNGYTYTYSYKTKKQIELIGFLDSL